MRILIDHAFVDGSATFSSHDTNLFYTPDEMDAFAKGVIDGEFDLR